MYDDFMYKGLLEELHCGVYFVSKDRKITFWNKTAEKITGFFAEEVIDKQCSENILTHIDKEGRKLCLSMCPLAASMNDKKPREAEVFLHHKDGHRVPVLVRVCPMFDPSGNVIGGYEIFSDLSSNQSSKLRILELEQFDALDELTKLSNKKHIEEELNIRFAEFKNTGIQFGVLFIKIDDYNDIIESYGSEVGDKSLKMVANSLLNNCRPFDVYGRWSTDEFVGIIRNVNSDQLSSVGEKNRMIIENSYLILSNTDKVSLTVSLGGTVVKADDNSNRLTARAEEVLREGILSGKNKVTIG